MAKSDAKPAADAKPVEVMGKEMKKKVYRSTQDTSVLFDIQIKNEMIYGQWSDGQKRVEFHVPEHLIEGFELHYHFVSGNLAATAE